MNDNDIVKCFSLLCDGMKRLERAIQEDGYDREYYLREAKERRERIEKIILGRHDKERKK